MPKILCASSPVKKFLRAQAVEFGDPNLASALKKLPECDDGAPFELGRGGSGAKRAPSAYNRYIGVCLKGGATMKACALQWKQEKKS